MQYLLLFSVEIEIRAFRKGYLSRNNHGKLGMFQLPEYFGVVFFRETQIRKERENEFFRKCHNADNLSYDPI